MDTIPKKHIYTSSALLGIYCLLSVFAFFPAFHTSCHYSLSKSHIIENKDGHVLCAPDHCHQDIDEEDHLCRWQIKRSDTSEYNTFRVLTGNFVLSILSTKYDQISFVRINLPDSRAPPVLGFKV
ncbi:hypothetical protein QA601_11075 [Chitinispirillales bacterium ANBcel5]|uniref:hypothetical protein n=1 Tax=Cellulosispirillum alkaliphilum TaxID=3039283 RepID=UPI002A50ED40|nr:hypothetical protein [Chitinispirillales bacterium ANBcel5]